MKILLSLIFSILLQSVIADAPKVFFDENYIRYQLVNQNSEGDFNWLLIPGGPGCDSCSLQGLSDGLNLPGSTWLVDFPGNGSNTTSEEYDYEEWLSLAAPMVKRFPKPIWVGVSFGGILSLITPELENSLHGLVIVSSCPSMWLEEAAKCAVKYNLPDFNLPLQEFVQNPSEENLAKTLEASLPYYFYKKESFEQGRALLKSSPFAVKAVSWWFQRVNEKSYNATWIPEKVPTLVLGGEFDYMTPFDIFKNDVRFDRPNIELVEIKEAGHFCWIDNPEAIKAAFKKFELRLSL